MRLATNNISRTVAPDGEEGRTAEEQEGIEHCEGKAVDDTLTTDCRDDVEGYYMPIIGQFHRPPCHSVTRACLLRTFLPPPYLMSKSY